MSLFFLTFLSLYATMHFVVWRGVRPLLPDSRFVEPVALCWMLLMIAAPMITRVLEQHGWDRGARFGAWLGYLWLGLLFIAFCLFAARGAVTLGLLLMQRFHVGLGPGLLTSPTSAGFVLLLTLVLGGYALFEAATIRTETIRINSASLPPGLERLRIVQISDLHLGLIHRRGMLAEVMAMTAALQPDLFVATGDIVDARLEHLEDLVPLCRSLDPPLGKYAVTGNHEVYAGLKNSLDFLEACGFTVLRNRSEALRPGLIIAGVDDPASGAARPEGEVLPARKEGFTLLLKHRPQIAPQSLGRFDLQLSGHTHRGQIFPFNLLTGLQYPLQNGLHLLSGGALIYASRGTGTWGPPMRLFSPPEITLFIVERPPSP